MTKIELLQALSEKVCQCTKCNGLLDSRIQTVFGEGNPNAKIVLCGEAPGEKESETGRPFVGRAGELLDKIIKACDWKREDLYILNILKCRPPKNRLPSQEEAKNCEPYLKMQLKIINPKYIICLGGTAAKYILQTEESIGRLRKQWFSYKDAHVNADVLATYHPSYLLRNPAAKVDVWNDLQLLIQKL